MVRVHAGPQSNDKGQITVDKSCQLGFCQLPIDQGGLAQLARAPALQAGGHRFDSDILHRRKRLDKRVWSKSIEKVRRIA